MNIKDQVQEIINSRKGLGSYVGRGRLAVIEKNLAFVEKLEAEVGAFEKFLGNIQVEIQAANSTFADFIEKQPKFLAKLDAVQLDGLKQKIAAQKRELLRLHNRFSRESVQIAFIGQARQGKSRFLQRISGLNDEIIPSSSATDCTGAISIIKNYDGVSTDCFEVELEYYSVLEFIAAVNNKLAQLFPNSNLSISTLSEIPNLSEKPEFKNTEDRELLDFKETYIDGYNLYAQLLGKPNEVKNDAKIVAEYVSKYKIFDSEKEVPKEYSVYRKEKKCGSGMVQVLFCKYVAVKVAYITTRFPYHDAGKIVLVDTIGLGNSSTEVEDKAKMFDVLKNESDAAVYIYKPSEDGASKSPKAEVDLLEELQRELADYNPSKWCVGVINKKSEANCTKKGREYEMYKDYLRTIQDTLSKETVLAWCKIVDAMSEREVTDNLVIPLLQTVIKNIDDIDSSFMIKAEDDAVMLYNEYMDVCSKIGALCNLFVTNEDKKAIFDAEFENLQLKTELEAYVENLHEHVNEPSMKIVEDLAPFVDKITSYIPKANDIEKKMRQGGTYAWDDTVYGLYMDEIRSRILSVLKQVGSQSILAIQSQVQNDLISMLFESGGLKNIKLKSFSSNVPSAKWFKAFIAEKLNHYPVLKSAFQSVAEFEMRIEGFVYSKCICACEKLRPGKTKLPVVEEEQTIEDRAIYIQQALYAVILDVKQRLFNELKIPQKGTFVSQDSKPIDEFSMPNVIMWCMADTFRQEIRNGQGGRELESFYWENANCIWRDKILQGEKLHESATIWNEWSERLNSICEIENFRLISNL